MAHITYAKVAGLAGRTRDIEIKFDRSVNVLFGVNGVGKTTFLKILHSAFENNASSVQGLAFASAEVGIYSLKAGREIVRELKNSPDTERDEVFDEVIIHELSGNIRRERVVNNGRRVWKLKGKRIGDIDTSSFAHEYLPTTRLISVSDMASGRRAFSRDSEEASINSMMETQLQQQWVRYFSPVQAKAQEIQQQGIAKILSTVLAAESGSEELGELNADIAYNLTKSFLASHSSLKMPGTKASFLAKYSSDRRLASVVSQIAAIESELERVRRPRDQLQLLLNKLFLNKQVDLSSGNIRIVCGQEGVRTPLRLSQLSSGEKQALFVLIHALRADSNALIVDEPELSMHIDWQRQLVGAIANLNPTAQIVMATHSPEVMADVPDSCIFEI